MELDQSWMAVALLVSRSQTLAQGEGLREGLAPRD